MLEEINQKVQQKLNLEHKNIILNYYQQLINNHNEFCGCNYCIILQNYVSLKVYKNRLNKRYEKEVDYLLEEKDYFNIEKKHLESLSDIKIQINKLKLEKDKLKKLE